METNELLPPPHLYKAPVSDKITTSLPITRVKIGINDVLKSSLYSFDVGVRFQIPSFVFIKIPYFSEYRASELNDVESDDESTSSKDSNFSFSKSNKTTLLVDFPLS